MTVFLSIIAVIAVILTLWLILIPAGMVVSGFSAFHHRGHDDTHGSRRA